MTNRLVVVTILLFPLVACSAENDQRESAAATVSIADLSTQFQARVRDNIGEGGIAEAHYLAGNRIIYMDKYVPHLRLFSVDGDLLWSGGMAGGAPNEFEHPHAIGVSGDTVLVLQRGRVSRWLLEADSLTFHDFHTLPAELAPLGMTTDCSGEWLFLGRNGRDLAGVRDGSTRDEPAVHIWTMVLGGRDARLTPWWAIPWDPGLTPATGHSAVLIGRTGSTIAAHFRPNIWGAGELLEFGCGGDLRPRYSEDAMVKGEGVRVHLPKPAALQWVGGVAALPDGMLVAIQRYQHPGFYDVPEPEWKTEVFQLQAGEYRGSVLIDSQWFLMDYDTAHGVLLAGNFPVPHFMRVPLAALLPSAAGRN